MDLMTGSFSQIGHPVKPKLGAWRRAAQGSLLAQALGDTLGAPIETASPADAARYVDEVFAAPGLVKVGRPPHPFGQYTDDTQLARLLAQSLVACGGMSGADYAARLGPFVTEGHLVGGGKTTLAAAQKLVTGTLWAEAGSDRPTNGAAMRAAPAGLFYARQPTRAAHAAAEQAQVTHTHPQAVAAAQAVAVGAATLVDAPFDPIHWLEGVAHACSDPWPHLCERLADGYRRPLPDLFTHMNDLLPSPLPEKAGLSTYAPHAVFWAMASFLRHPDDALPALADALRAGGDTDTSAALAGALVGTRVGPEGLPKTLVDDLTDNGDWRAEKLAELMAKLAAAADRAV